MSAELQVAVVGGAVAGSAVACALRRVGADVTVFEKRDLDRDPNRGDALHGSTLEALDRIGARPALEARGPVWMHRVTLQDWKERFRIPIDAEPPGLMILNHGEIENALLGYAVSLGAVVRREAVHEIRREGEGWLLTTPAGQTRARFLIGADGSESPVRKAVGIGVEAKKYKEALVVLHAPQPVWLPADEAIGMLHPDGGFMVVPTTPRGHCRLVVIVREAEVAQWLEASDGKLAELLGARSPRLATMGVSRRGGTHLYRVSKQHAEAYWRPGLALLGDAAHVTHPNGGQGMNMAIQDAEALARHLAPALTGDEAARAAALTAYEAERRPRNQKAMDRADAGTRFQKPQATVYAMALGGLAFSAAFPAVIRRYAQRLATVGG